MKTCELCGISAEQVTRRLAHYAATDAQLDKYAAIWRCVDVDACRQRVSRSGRRWPLV